MREAYYLLAFFNYEHLPDKLQAKARPFYALAYDLEKRHYALSEKESKQAGQRLELEAAMRKLLEAKDCAVRAGV